LKLPAERNAIWVCTANMNPLKRYTGTSAAASAT
jgi:hypothetical protein